MKKLFIYDVDFDIEGLEEVSNVRISDKIKSRKEDGEYLNFEEGDYNSEEAEML